MTLVLEKRELSSLLYNEISVYTGIVIRVDKTIYYKKNK